jgi:hypothetical protein
MSTIFKHEDDREEVADEHHVTFSGPTELTG